MSTIKVRPNEDFASIRDNVYDKGETNEDFASIRDNVYDKGGTDEDFGSKT